MLLDRLFLRLSSLLLLLLLLLLPLCATATELRTPLGNSVPRSALPSALRDASTPLIYEVHLTSRHLHAPTVLNSEPVSLNPSSSTLHAVPLSRPLEIFVDDQTFDFPNEHLSLFRTASGTHTIAYTSHISTDPLHKDRPHLPAFILTPRLMLTPLSPAYPHLYIPLLLNDDAPQHIVIDNLQQLHRQQQPEPQPTPNDTLIPPFVFAIPSSAPSCVPSAHSRHVDLLLSADSTLCALFSSSPSSLVSGLLTLISHISEPFREQTCLRINPLYLDLHCTLSTDPYQSLQTLNSSSYILTGYRDHLTSTTRRSLSRDTAILLTGFQPANSTVAGQAWLAAACRRRFHYAWVHGPDPKVFAHELAHLVGALHSADGLMMPFISDNTPMTFAPVSVVDMSNFVASNSAKCLRLVTPSPTPSATPLPTPSNKPMSTCQDGFRDTKQLSCSQYKMLGRIWTHAGLARIYVKQSFASIFVRVLVNSPSDEDATLPRVRLRSLAMLATWRTNQVSEILSNMHGAAVRTYHTGTGAKRITASVEAGEVERRGFWRSCCQRNVTLHTHVVVEETIVTEDGLSTLSAVGKGRFSWRVLCKDPCKGFAEGGRSRPALIVGRKCPDCIPVEDLTPSPALPEADGLFDSRVLY